MCVLAPHVPIFITSTTKWNTSRTLVWTSISSMGVIQTIGASPSFYFTQKLMHWFPVHKKDNSSVFIFNSTAAGLWRSINLAFQFLSNFCPIPALYNKIPAFYSEIPAFTPISIFLAATVLVTYMGRSPQAVSGLQPLTACEQCTDKGRWRGHVDDNKLCGSVCLELFWHVSYCAKPRPNPESQSGSWYPMVLGRRDPCIMQEYNLATTIVIRKLTHTRTCEMGSSSFSDMS